MNRKYIWLMVLCIAAALFLYPYPSTGFLYRNAGVLKGKISDLKGASVVLFLDPSFYYRFRISPSELQLAVSALGLRKSSRIESDMKSLKRHGPWFWNRWWWRPAAGPLTRLYKGYIEGNRFYFHYNYETHVAHLYIQNT
jgi:hypothetical protein